MLTTFSLILSNFILIFFVSKLESSFSDCFGSKKKTNYSPKTLSNCILYPIPISLSMYAIRLTLSEIKAISFD